MGLSAHTDVCLLTCGRRTYTKEQAQLARDANITMFAVGVGRSVSDRELNNIAGSPDRVIKVTSYKDLQKIKDLLAYKTCVRKSLHCSSVVAVSYTHLTLPTNHRV